MVLVNILPPEITYQLREATWAPRSPFLSFSVCLSSQLSACGEMFSSTEAKALHTQEHMQTDEKANYARASFDVVSPQPCLIAPLPGSDF